MQKILISNSIVELLDGLSFTKSQYSLAVSFIEYFILLLIKGEMVNEYNPIPATYFRNAFGTHYLKTLQALKNSNIILCNESYSNGLRGKQFCKEYKINSDLLDTNFKLIDHKLRADETDILQDELRIVILDDLNKLTVDIDAATISINKYIQELPFKINDQISENSFELHVNDKRKIFTSLERAKEIAFEDGKDLISYKNKYFLHNAKKFKKDKAKIVHYCYHRFLAKLLHNQYYCKRNSTNYRIDTNLTSMPSRLIPYLSIEGQKLLTVDCKNSQLVIFASILKNPTLFKDNSTSYFKDKFYSSSSEEFITVCEKGEIYDRLGEVLNIDRPTAKTKMFEIIFSSHANNTPAKKALKLLYPDIIKLIDGYKKEYGDNKFAVLLQRIESEIFIDNIYTELKKEQATVYTKHDSILYKASDEDLISTIISETMKRYKVNASF